MVVSGLVLQLSCHFASSNLCFANDLQYFLFRGTES